MTPVRARAARLWLLLALGGLLAGCGASTIPPVHSEPERLSYGRLALERREYNVAIDLLKTYVANNAGGAEVDKAIELLGEAYLHVREWSLAQTEFERLLRDYPESDSAASGSYQLGEALWGQSRGADFDQEFTQKALDQWQTYLRSYPGHWLNAQAQLRVQRARERLASKMVDTGVLYVKLKRTGPARVYFQRVLDEYPDTAQAGNALLGMALADERDGKRDAALATLREVEARYPGQVPALRAAQERAHLEGHPPKAPREKK